jgi:cytochrome P450
MSEAREVRPDQPYRDPRRPNAEVVAEWKIDTGADPYAVPLESFNVGHPDLFEADVMWGYFRRLREEAPVHFCADSQFGPYWSFTRYEDCQYIDSHHEIFSSDQRYGGIALGGRPNPEAEFSLPSFITMDPPQHDVQRKVVTPMFAPSNLAKLQTLIRERAATILDNLPRNEEFNWVRAVSVELTGQMLATLFDVPQEDRSKLIYWSDITQAFGDPERFQSVADGFAALQECLTYFRGFWDERAAKEPSFDLISMLAHGEETKDMDPALMLGTLMLLIIGGNDTTRNSISGGVLALNQHPDQYAKLRANHELVGSMIPEIIRWQSPVAHMARTAMEDVDMHGHTIRAGDRVAMWYISGNRDATAIERPDEFIIDRANPRKHLSFGFGVHRCLGNRLAEMQLRTIWEEILKRFDRIEVTGEPRFLKSGFIHGITDLPVTIRG